MPSLADIAQSNNITQQFADNARGNELYTARQQAAQQASQLYQQGDIRGAYSAMIAADPAFAEKIAPELTKIDPDLAQQLTNKTETGKLSAEHPYSSTPGDVAQIKANAARAKGEEGTVARDPQSPTGWVLKTRNGVFPFDAYGSGANKAPDAAATPANPAQPAVPGATKPVADPNALPKNIAPDHQKAINAAVDSLSKDPEVKDMNTEINGLKQADDLAAGNLPNSQIPLTMKFLESSEFVKRFNEAEFKQGPAEAQATIDKVKNAYANKTLGNLDPGVMANFRDIISVMQHSTLNQYEGKLHSLAGGVQTKTNGKITADQAFNALVPASNDIFKQKAAIFNKLPDSDKEAVKWARQNLGDPKAREILRHNGL